MQTTGLLRSTIAVGLLLTCLWAGMGSLCAKDTDGLPGVLPPPSAGSHELLVPGLEFESDEAAKQPDTKSASQQVTPDGEKTVLNLAEQSVPVAPPAWYQLSYWFGPIPWEAGLEMGLNGNEGVNSSLSTRAGGYVRRKTEAWKFDSKLAYNRNAANQVETQNNALLDSRWDRHLGESPWTWFVMNQVLYDRFQTFDLRVSANTGIGYQFVDWETTNLTGRFGSGASRDYGVVEERWAWEALFGLDFSHRFSPSQRVSAKVDYFPEWEDFSLFRMVADVGWEIDLDRPKNVSLKFSIIDRFDNTPTISNNNELNYSALLIWAL